MPGNVSRRRKQAPLNAKRPLTKRALETEFTEGLSEAI